VKHYPDCLPAHINLTVWYSRNNDLDKAIHHGERAIAIAPAGLPGRKNLAAALIKANRHREAIAILRVAVDHHINDPAIWRMLHECFVALGDNENAAACLRQLP
jgi:predicted Zn-dependent protease